MHPSKAKSIHHFIVGNIVVVLGVIILWKRTGFFLSAMFVVSLLVVLGGLAQVVGWMLQKPKKARTLFLALLYVLLGLIMIFFPQIPVFVLPVLFSAYLMMNGLVKLIDSLLIIHNKSGELLYSLIPSLFYLTFAVILLFSPRYHIQSVLIIIGIYCILLGVTYIGDFIRSLIPNRTKQNLRRRIRITLPIFFAAFIPHTVLTKLNEFLSAGDKHPDEFEDLGDCKLPEKPDLEIFIHVAKDGFCAIGHCDICFDGELIAYGNYDEAAQLPMGVGPGVLLVTNKYQYLPFCLAFNKTTIFSFGLKLTDAQKEAVRNEINSIKSRLVPWNPSENPKNHDIFAAQFCRGYDAHCYKFTGGKFKTYFVMSTNCVLLAESIVCRTGTDILNLNGIISPGTFYDYLEAEFLKKESMVITRHVYRLPLTQQLLREEDGIAQVPEGMTDTPSD